MGSYLFKKVLPHLISVIIIIGLNVIYFYPSLSGKALEKSDSIASSAMSKEAKDLQAETGENVLWTNAMFGGMPTYHIGGYGVSNLLEKTRSFLSLFFSTPIGAFNLMGISFYILFLVVGLNPWVSLIGALGCMLTTNNYVLWGAGHSNKMYVIGTSGLVIAGILAAYWKEKYLQGLALFGYGLGINLYFNHIQMTYYLFLGMLVFTGIFFFHKLRTESLNSFLKGSLALTIGGILAVGASTANLWTNYEYAKDTMRGEAILKKVSNTEAKSSSETDGLAWDYAMQWSDGFIDLFGIYIPRAAGGSSAEKIGSDSELYKDLVNRGASLNNDFAAPLYWGGRGSTSGPNYMGAVLFLLFLMGIQMVKGPIKWWLVSAFGLMMLLSLGGNFPILNKPLFNYFPLFSKFRAPSSVMGITGVFFIILAMLGLSAILKRERSTEQTLKKLYISLGIAGGLSLFFVLVAPSMFDFSANSDARLTQAGYNINALIEDRKDAMSGDALRSLLFVLVSSGIIWLFIKEKINSTILLLGIGALATIDLWTVGQRYLSAKDFVTPTTVTQNFNPRPVDQTILNAEKSRGDYRVLDLSIQTFSSSATSYYHNTIGGYHPAKLQRYQDIIDQHLYKNNQAVLNMLNTKYIITQNQQVQTNPNALGTAWFVNGVKKVNTPQEEIDGLSGLNPTNEAVVLENEFGGYLEGFTPQKQGTISLTNYKPNHLTYASNTNAEQLAVFSEIWYGPHKGWQAYVDGNPVDHIRANYILRAMKIPSGNHKVEFKFEPSGFKIGETLSIISSGLIILFLLGFIGINFKKLYEDFQNNPTPQPIKEKKVVKTTSKKKKRKKR